MFPACHPGHTRLLPSLSSAVSCRSSCLHPACSLGIFHALLSAAWTEEGKDKITQGCDALTGLVLTGKKRKTLGGPSNSQYMIIFIDTISPWQRRKPTVVGRHHASERALPTLFIAPTEEGLWQKPTGCASRRPWRDTDGPGQENTGLLSSQLGLCFSLHSGFKR